MGKEQNIRNTKPYSLAPLTPEEALRRIMSTPKPDDDAESEPSEEKPRKRRGSKNGK